jgi:hypothetical protein
VVEARMKTPNEMPKMRIKTVKQVRGAIIVRDVSKCREVFEIVAQTHLTHKLKPPRNEGVL